MLTFAVQFIKWRTLSSGVQEKHNEASRSFFQGLGDWDGKRGGSLSPTMDISEHYTEDKQSLPESSEFGESQATGFRDLEDALSPLWHAASKDDGQSGLQCVAPPPSRGASAFLLLVACAMQEGETGCFITGAADCSPSPVSEAAAEFLSGPGRRRTAPASQLASYRLPGGTDSSFSSQSLQPGDASSAQSREGHQPLRHPQASALKVAVSCCPGDSAVGLSFAHCTEHSDHS